MTTISSNALQGSQLTTGTATGSSSASGSTDNSTAAQIAQISKKITQLTEKLREASSTPDRPAEEKKKQVELLQTEIKMLPGPAGSASAQAG